MKAVEVLMATGVPFSLISEEDGVVLVLHHLGAETLKELGGASDFKGVQGYRGSRIEVMVK